MPLPLQPWTSKMVGPESPQEKLVISLLLIVCCFMWADFSASISVAGSLKRGGVTHNLYAIQAVNFGDILPPSWKPSRSNLSISGIA